jgi:type 1 glutamine amidotransferase
MRHYLVGIVLLLLASFALPSPLPAGGKPRVLVFTKTAGWDHGTRAVADSVIRGLGATGGFAVDTTDATGTFFTDSSLAAYKAVCFVNTTGTLFTEAQREAFKRFIRAGGGYVGIHASTDCEYDWGWYGDMAGAYFNGHPFNVATAKVAILDKRHPSTEFISEDTLIRTDEGYFWGQNPDFRNNPLVNPAGNDSVNVLMELVESSIEGSGLKAYHPICWYRHFEGGRVWYSGFGHAPQTFNDPLMKRMLSGGIRWAAGLTGTMVMAPDAAVISVTPAPEAHRPAVYDALGRMIDVNGRRRQRAIASPLFCYQIPKKINIVFLILKNNLSNMLISPPSDNFMPSL